MVGKSGQKSPFRRSTPHGNKQVPGSQNLPGLGSCRTMKRAPKMGKNKLIIVNLSGRGDKDVSQVAAKVGLKMPK